MPTMLAPTEGTLVVHPTADRPFVPEGTESSCIKVRSKLEFVARTETPLLRGRLDSGSELSDEHSELWKSQMTSTWLAEAADGTQ